MHDAPRRSLTDRTDGCLDKTGVEERLALAGAAERDKAAATLEVCDRDIRDLRRGRMKSRGLGRRGVPLVAQRDDLWRSFICGRGDRERAVLQVKERVRRGAAAVLLRAARELFDEPIRRMLAERRVQSCLQIRRIYATCRFDDHTGDDEIAARIGSDSGIGAGRQRGGPRILRIRRKTDAEIAERKDRADRQAAITEWSRAARTVEANRVARRESVDLRTLREC